MVPIAAEGCTFSFDGMAPMSLVSCAPGPASLKVKAGGAGAYRGLLTVNAVFATTGAPPTLPLVFSIAGSAAKCVIDGQPAMLEGDASAPVPWAYTVPGGAVVSGSAVCKIGRAGQSAVKAS